MKALVVYDSLGGNTEKVAGRIHEALQNGGIEAGIIKASKDADADLYEYDILFLGSPVIAWGPTDAMRDFAMRKLREYHDTRIRPSVPLRPGKFGISFCTYSGTHIGVDEAIPLTKWFSAFLGHLGCHILAEWHVVGEFHKPGDHNVKGRMGDIRGRPDEHDLQEIQNQVKGVLASLEAYYPETA